MVILIIFQNGNLKDCLNKLSNLLIHLNNSLVPTYIANKTRVKFDGGCLKQEKITLTHGKTVNIYIVYELIFSTRGYDDYTTLENCLFGAVKLTKNVDIDKCKYSGYGVGFDRREICHFVLVDLVAM